MTWNQLRRVALDRTKPGYDAVFVDEAQDLPPVAIRFLTKIAKSPQGIFLTADANQSIYQRDFSWKMVDSALDMRGKTAILKRDYRTTKAIHAAVKNVAVKLGLDQDGFPEPGRREGPRPRLVALQGTNPFDKLAQEITQACRQARLPLGAVAVLAPTNALINSTIMELNSRGIDAFHAKEEELELDHPAVKVLSLQSAKGMEFPIVFVTGIERGILPRMVRDTPSEELAVHREQDARLFFVACSRAMRMLVVTYSAHCPSEFVTELDESAWEHVGAVAS
jgi:superfamily I DNA/RNA helicase